MLIEFGFVRATTGDGRVFTFTPSLGRIASLGSPHEIVSLYCSLHGPHAEKEAAYVLACLCDQEDPTEAVGWHDDEGKHPGLIPPDEQVILARHLMGHGIVGKAKPDSGKGDGQFSDKFEASVYIAAARVHLGLSSADAEALSMTEFQQMLEMKYPQAKEGQQGARDVPTREEYQAALKAIEERERV